jgi:hypothetical protein
MSDEPLTPLEKAHAAMRARREAGEVITRRTPLEKAAAKPTSLRLAIDGKCFDCVGQDCDPGWRERIRTCSVSKCPLHPVRPYQRGDAEEEST